MLADQTMNQHILSELRCLSTNVMTLSREVGISNEGLKGIHQICAAHDRALEGFELDMKETESDFHALRGEYDETKLLARDMVTQAARNTQGIAELNASLKTLTLAVAANTSSLHHIQADDGPLDNMRKDIGLLRDEQIRLRLADRRERLAIAIISMLNTAGLGWIALSGTLGSLFGGG